jgi:hypothetical protein
MQQSEHGYSPGDDGLLVEHVGHWVNHKHKILADYVQASGGARRKFVGNGAAYIDVFSGPGRSKIRDTDKFIDGSPIVAFKQGKISLAPFTSIEISDVDDVLLHAAVTRLLELIDAGSEHVSFDASKHVLAIAGIKPAAEPQVSVNLEIRAGYVIDLRDDPAPALRVVEQKA